jgi:hypothetical protein
VGACFLTAFIELLIIIAIIIYQRKTTKTAVERDNYFDLGSERDIRPKESSFKGIAMGDLKMIREANSNDQNDSSAMKREE